jgi:phosphatidylinositol phospholipase C delta
MINHAMFQRNGRAGYVLKPPALRQNGRELLQKHTRHFFDVRIISGQQLPRRRRMRDELIKTVIDPLVEVSLHVPDWTAAPFLPSTPAVDGAKYAPPEGPGAGGVASASLSPGSAAGTGMAPSTARVLSYKTAAVKNNGFNPVWEERCSLPFDCVGDMADLVFVRFAIRDDGDDDDDDPIAMFCCSLSSLRQGEPLSFHSCRYWTNGTTYRIPTLAAS